MRLIAVVYYKPKKKKVKSPYARRNDLIRSMGYGSYAHYLASSLWSDIRERVLERDRRECYGCLGKATQVHHGNYGAGTMGGETLIHLYSVCRGCHEWCEDSRGRKWGPGPVEATRRLRERRKGAMDKLRKGSEAKPFQNVTTIEEVRRGLARSRALYGVTDEQAEALRAEWRREDQAERELFDGIEP